MHNGGFTLIELLIVIGIIAILAAAVIIAINPGQQFAAARNSTRNAHLSSLETAIYSEYVYEGEYPDDITDELQEICNTNLDDPDCTDMVDLGDTDLTIPVDPQAEGDSAGYEVAVIDNEVALNAPNAELDENISMGPVDDEEEWACGDSYEDPRDGETYQTVEIGDQCWMAENLAYLPEVHSNNEFETQGNNNDPGYGVYDYDGSDVSTAKAQSNYDTYGVLYNWYAVDQEELCPDDWSVPTSDGDNSEFHELEEHLADNSCDGTRDGSWDCDPAGAKLAGNSTLWDSGDLTDHSDFGETGFDVLPGGRRDASGSFDRESTHASFWSSSDDDAFSGQAWRHHLRYDYSTVSRYDNSKERGYSVRCLRD